MALVVKDMWEDPVCDNHQFQINMKIMTSAHNRCTMPWLPWAEATNISLIEQTKRTKSPSCTLSIWRWKKKQKNKTKHTVLILISPELELWHVSTLSPCCSVQQGLWFLARRSAHAARGHRAADDGDGFDLFSHNRKTARPWWNMVGPVALGAVTQEQDGLLAACPHIAPQPLSAPADPPLYPEVHSFTRNKELQLAGITSNITISCKLGT